jgi:hypothetical protein
LPLTFKSDRSGAWHHPRSQHCWPLLIATPAVAEAPLLLPDPSLTPGAVADQHRGDQYALLRPRAPGVADKAATLAKYGIGRDQSWRTYHVSRPTHRGAFLRSLELNRNYESS